MYNAGWPESYVKHGRNEIKKTSGKHMSGPLELRPGFLCMVKQKDFIAVVWIN